MSDSERAPFIDAYIRQRRRRRMTGLLLVILLAALPIALLISSRAFDIAVIPVEAAATAALSRVYGRLLIVGSRVLLLSRNGVIALEARGFSPRTVELERNSDRQQIQVALEPLPGIVVITVTSPVDFDLRIGETSFGAAARVEVELERGLHAVRIEGSRVKPMVREIEIEGYGKTQQFEFEAEPGRSALSVRTDPPGARVFLDGVAVGQGGFEGVVDLGSHEVAIELDGYHDHRQRFVTAAEERLDLGTIELLPKAATVAIASEPGEAAVLVDGEFAGSTPLQLSLQPLSAYRLTIRKSGHEPMEARIEPAPGEAIERTFRLSSRTYRASITADIEARVTVNGVDAGVTPAGFQVRAGDRIEVSRDGYQSRSVTVSPVGGAERAYAFTMLRPNEYAFHQAEQTISLPNGMKLRKFPPATIRLQPSQGSAAMIEKALTRPFYMGLREVSYREYLDFDARPIPKGSTPEHPVTNLTWAEAARYCNWLSDRAGLPPVYEFDADGELQRIVTVSLGYRLPTEAEWEAVAGHDFTADRTRGPFPWGESLAIPRAFGNFAGREVDGQVTGRFLFDHVDNHVGTAPVGSYPANVNGLYDLAGNVAEWVTDFHGSLPRATDGPLVDPIGPSRGIDHVVKGASFRTGELSALAIAYRTFTAGKSDAVGFRIARWIY